MTSWPFHSCSFWNRPVLPGSKSLPSLPLLLPAFPPAAFCVPGKGMVCDVPATCFPFSLLLLLLLLPPQPKRQLVLDGVLWAELGDSSLLLHLPDHGGSHLCGVLDGSLPLWWGLPAASPPGQRWGMDCCMSSTEGHMRICVPKHASTHAHHYLHPWLKGT